MCVSDYIEQLAMEIIRQPLVYRPRDVDAHTFQLPTMAFVSRRIIEVLNQFDVGTH